MQLDFPQLSPALLNLEPWSIAIIVPVAGLIFAGALIITTMYFQNRRREMWHQTARLALEKGQPLPPLPGEDEAPKRNPDENSDFRAGLILVAAGIGLYLFLGTFLGRGLGYVGAIPGLIGVALLLYATIRVLTRSKSSSLDDRSNQP